MELSWKNGSMKKKKGFSSFLFAQQKEEEKNLSSLIFRLGQIDFLFVFDIFSNLNPLFYGLGCRVVFDYKNERKASSLSSRNIPLHFRSSFSDLERNPFRKLQLKNEKWLFISMLAFMTIRIIIKKMEKKVLR